jgi:hypothetical protein
MESEIRMGLFRQVRRDQRRGKRGPERARTLGSARKGEGEKAEGGVEVN